MPVGRVKKMPPAEAGAQIRVGRRAVTNPDSLAALRWMLSNAVVSRHAQRAYLTAFDGLVKLAAGRPISRMILMEYRASMVAEGLSAATINQRLCAIRKLVNEARENGLIDPAEAVRLTSVPGVPQNGVRLGTWLTKEEICLRRSRRQGRQCAAVCSEEERHKTQFGDIHPRAIESLLHATSFLRALPITETLPAEPIFSCQIQINNRSRFMNFPTVSSRGPPLLRTMLAQSGPLDSKYRHTSDSSSHDEPGRENPEAIEGNRRLFKTA